jgi:hypothetical protein
MILHAYANLKKKMNTTKFIIEDKNTIMNNDYIVKMNIQNSNSRKRKNVLEDSTVNKKPKYDNAKRNSQMISFMSGYFGRSWIDAKKQFDIAYPVDDNIEEDDEDSEYWKTLIDIEPDSYNDDSSSEIDDSSDVREIENESEDENDSSEVETEDYESDTKEIENLDTRNLLENQVDKPNELFNNSNSNFDYYNFYYLNEDVIGTYNDLYSDYFDY